MALYELIHEITTTTTTTSPTMYVASYVSLHIRIHSQDSGASVFSPAQFKRNALAMLNENGHIQFSSSFFGG